MSPAEGSKNPRKSIIDFTNSVDVIVDTGDQETRFVVHEQLLTDRSLFSKKALSGTWVEAKERKVKLPEDNHEVFGIYVNLLYTDRIITSPIPSSDDDGRIERRELIDLYILAEKLQDVITKNKVIIALLASLCAKKANNNLYTPGHMIIRRVYAGTPPGSVLRKIFADLYASRSKKEWLEPIEKFPEDFVRETLLSVMSERQRNKHLVDPMDAGPYLEPEDTPLS